jgi:hypothetical protein
MSPLPPNEKRIITLVPSHSMLKEPLTEFYGTMYKADDDVEVQAMSKMQESDDIKCLMTSEIKVQQMHINI